MFGERSSLVSAGGAEILYRKVRQELAKFAKKTPWWTA